MSLKNVERTVTVVISVKINADSRIDAENAISAALISALKMGVIPEHLRAKIVDGKIIGSMQFVFDPFEITNMAEED